MKDKQTSSKEAIEEKHKNNEQRKRNRASETWNKEKQKKEEGIQTYKEEIKIKNNQKWWRET